MDHRADGDLRVHPGGTYVVQLWVRDELGAISEAPAELVLLAS